MDRVPGAPRLRRDDGRDDLDDGRDGSASSLALGLSRALASKPPDNEVLLRVHDVLSPGGFKDSRLVTVVQGAQGPTTHSRRVLALRPGLF